MENKIKRITIKNDVIRIWRYPSQPHEYNRNLMSSSSYKRLLAMLQSMHLDHIDYDYVMYTPKGF